METMTYKQARENGYRHFGESAYSRGYISRKTELTDNTQCYCAGGKQAGKIFYEMPCFDSTQYHIRVYMRKTF